MMDEMPDACIDMILCDLPYGQTARNKWDVVIPFESLWMRYRRIIKDNGAIVLFANGMFTANLMKSNSKMWRYNLIWEKTTPTGFLNANMMPLRSHEDICVFYKSHPVYNPQKTQGHRPVHNYTKHSSDGSNYGNTKTGVSGGGSTERFPKSVLHFSTDKQKSSIHPTQKPVALCEWLIRTYTNPNDIVFDGCAGSFTTFIAAYNTNRKYTGCEKDSSEFEKGVNRLKNHIENKTMEIHDDT
jgi:site-specific DNA-methyltransferase (adenine-specific)